MFAAAFGAAALGARGAEWKPILVPGAWEEKGPAEARTYDGIAWYRTWIKVPDNFVRRGDKRDEVRHADTVGVVLRDVADAHEVFVNGVKIGAGGRFPPAFEGTRDRLHRHKVPLGVLVQGGWNELAVRIYNHTGPGGFLRTPPRLMNIMVECVLQGTWEFLAADGYQPGKARPQRPETSAFDQFQPSNFVLGRLAELDPGPKLSPAEALAAMHTAGDLQVELVLSEPRVTQPTHLSFDARGRLWVSQYRQYPYPAGLNVIGRSALQEAIFDRVPPPPPHHDRGADVISIHEDTDGDGTFDRHSVFQDGLNLANSAVRGWGGVWVTHAPYLLFYPDRDFDDIPDGPPEVKLQGFGLEDTHAVANALTWGPDGWLYGGQGSTTTSRIVRPGIDPSDTKGVFFDGSMVWRYHPKTGDYEIFAKGGGNTFGLEFDGHGRLYSGHNGGQTRGFHYVQGGYFTLQRPGPEEMYAFGQLPAMKTLTPVRRFSHFGAFAEGTAIPARYQGQLFAIDPLHNEVIVSERHPLGSTFETRDVGRALWTSDVAFRPLNIVNAPDGSLLVSDMYEYYTAHRNHYQSQIDPGTGRVYRLRGRDARLEADTNLERRSSRELLTMLDHPNKWHRHMAAQLLGERNERALVPELNALLGQPREFPALPALWALHQMGALDDATAQAALRHPIPAVRLWTVRFLGDTHGLHRGPGLTNPRNVKSGALPPAVFSSLLEQAGREAAAEVRAQMAASARRLATGQALELVRALATHREDEGDPYIPLLLWWVLEAHERIARDQVIALFRAREGWQLPLVQEHLAPRLMRRFALEGRREDLDACTQLLRLAPRAADAAVLMKGFVEAYRGRELVDLPDELVQAMRASGQMPLILRVRQGDNLAIQEALTVIRNRRAPVDERLLYLRVFGEVRHDAAFPALLEVAAANELPPLRRAALGSLLPYDRPEVGPWAAGLLPRVPEEIRPSLLALLASRAGWSGHLLNAVETGQLPAHAVPRDLVDRMRAHADGTLATRLARVFQADADGSTAALRQRILGVETALRTGTGNPHRGEVVYTQRCASCHTLFDKGGRLGPDLTSYQRENLGTMIPSIVQPSAEIREGFQHYQVATHDGRSLSGFLVRRDAQIVVLRGWEGEDLTIRQADIARLEPVGRSLMPEGLLDDLDDQQIRDLFAYLRRSRPL
ncbi:MAG: c-type cytochrome [Opitutaceae bacterium]|nr:c-type cytochrome [Opitutaceae bacterium]